MVDTKAVARGDAGTGVNPRANGKYILFTDHERVVGELQAGAASAMFRMTDALDKQVEELRTALATSRAEVEGLRAACSGSAYTLFLDAYHKACETSKPCDWHDAALLAKQWEQQIDAAMEKGNV